MRQFLTFRVARQDFAMEAVRLRGLLPVHEVIPIQGRPGFGTAAIRGHEFLVVDLREKLGIAEGAPGRQPCVIAVEVRGARLLGFVADRISELINVREHDLRGDSVRVNGRLRRLLDPDEIFSDEELERLTALSSP